MLWHTPALELDRKEAVVAGIGRTKVRSDLEKSLVSVFEGEKGTEIRAFAEELLCDGRSSGRHGSRTKIEVGSKGF